MDVGGEWEGAWRSLAGGGGAETRVLSGNLEWIAWERKEVYDLLTCRFVACYKEVEPFILNPNVEQGATTRFVNSSATPNLGDIILMFEHCASGYVL